MTDFNNTVLNPGLGGDVVRTFAGNELAKSAKLQAIIAGSIISPVSQNSSLTALAGGATFTGQWEWNEITDVAVSCQTDAAGTLYFDFSPDGTNVNTFPSNGFQVIAGIHEFHTAVKGPRYFRVRFVNDAAAQTYLRLYTYYGQFRQPSAPLNQAVTLDADSLIVRPTFSWLDVARSLQTDIKVVKKFGRNAAVGTSLVPITASGVYNTPTSAVSLEVVSSDAGDALNGAGAHEYTFIGIDANWDEQTVAVAAHATDGTTAVAITGTWLRLYRAYVSKSGSYATATTPSHVGTITIRVAGAGATWAQIPLVNSFPIGQTLIGAYTIPRNYKGYVFQSDISVNSGKTANVIFFSRENADDVTASYTGTMRARSVITGLTGGVPFNRTGQHQPIGPIQGPADIGYLAAVSATTGEISVEFEIYLVKE